MKDATIGVIGAGVMGEGVAQAVAQAGMSVVLLDIQQTILDAARSHIERQLAVSGFFRKSSDAPPPSPGAIDRIRFTLDPAELHDAALIVENVTEKWKVKRDVYAMLETHCSAQAVFAANTSAIPITRIASVTRRPDQVIGMHFMNPVPRKPMVEVIRGFHTSEQTVQTSQAFLAALGKEGIVVNDAPGFVTNRVLMLTINEAIFLVEAGTAKPEDIDKLFKSCFGHPMGPLETADLIGLDTILYSIDVLYESFNDSKYRPCPLLRQMVDAGLFGRKNGRGFYTYQR